MSVAHCQQEVNAVEFTHWLAFDRIEPIGLTWLQTGVICATVANLLQALAGGKRKKAWTPEEFMPLLRATAKKKQTPAEMEAIFRMATSMHLSQMKEERRPKKGE